MAFIAIDLGTSFIKGALVDPDTLRLEHVRRVPFPDRIPLLDTLRYEIDPKEIVANVSGLILELARSCPHPEGLVMCTQMSSLVLTNEQGEVESNCFGWRDKRALEEHPSGKGSYYDVLKQKISSPHRRELGNELPPGAPISFLFWLAERRELKPGLLPLSLADYVVSALCGSPPGVDLTNAMAYGLLDLTTLDWHNDVIRQLGLSDLKWPEIRQHGEVVGLLTLDEKTIPCYTPVGDYQCALVGALLSEDELSLNISTGSQVSRLTPALELGDYQTRPFFSGRFVNTFSHLPAGRSLDILIDLLLELSRAEGMVPTDPWEYIARQAKSTADGDLQVNLSFYPGPSGDRGNISNIREGNLTVGSLFKAAFQNMADNYRHFALRIWPEQQWKNLVFSGGAARKLGLLRSIVEQKFQTSSRLCPFEEDTLLGLMLLARVFSGRSPSINQEMEKTRLNYDTKGSL